MQSIEITREQFNDDLYAFASGWIPKVRQKIANQADELFENKAVVFILHKYAELKDDVETFGKNDFEEMMRGEETSGLYEISQEKMRAYSSVLYDLLCK